MERLAGRTVNIPVSLDLLMKIFVDCMNGQGISMVDSKIIAPPRMRDSAVSTPILTFIKVNPGRYCTKEIIRQHPNLNAASIKAVLNRTRYPQLDKNEHGKWYWRAGQ